MLPQARQHPLEDKDRIEPRKRWGLQLALAKAKDVPNPFRGRGISEPLYPLLRRLTQCRGEADEYVCSRGSLSLKLGDRPRRNPGRPRRLRLAHPSQFTRPDNQLSKCWIRRRSPAPSASLSRLRVWRLGVVFSH